MEIAMKQSKRERIRMDTPIYSWGISAFFPEAIAHRAEQKCTVEAPTMEDAAKAAIHKLRQIQGIHGKHLRTVRLTISYLGPAADKRGQFSLDCEG